MSGAIADAFGHLRWIEAVILHPAFPAALIVGGFLGLVITGNRHPAASPPLAKLGAPRVSDDDVAAAREALKAKLQDAGMRKEYAVHQRIMTLADAYAAAQAAAARAEAERRAEGAEREIRAAWEVPCRCKSRNPADDSPRASYKVCGACEVRHAMATARYAAQALAEAPAEEVHDA